MADTSPPDAPSEDKTSLGIAPAQVKDAAPSASPEGAGIAQAPPQAAPPQPAPDAPYKQPEFTKRVNALIKGEIAPKEGTEELVNDIKDCAQKQDEARQALQQVTQFGQSKQAEIFGLEGQADALLRVLYRLENPKK